MSEYRTSSRVHLDLSLDEFRIVTRALSGRLKGEADIHDALKLYKSWMEQRETEINHIHAQVVEAAETARNLVRARISPQEEE